MRDRITTKAAMYRRLFAGEFGNRPLMWNSYEELVASGYRGEVSIRAKDISNPVRLYHVPFAQLESIISNLPAVQRSAGLVFSESPNDNFRTMQGELQELPGGLTLTYSLARKPMREAFDVDRRHAQGLEVKLLLARHLSSSDREWLQQLLEWYPEHVIEFSGFSRPVGVLRTKMFVWEVRSY